MGPGASEAWFDFTMPNPEHNQGQKCHPEKGGACAMWRMQF